MTVTPQNTNPTADNLLPHISRVAMVTGRSEKSGNDWTALELYWNKPSGKQYKQRVFLNQEALSIIEDTVPLPGSNALETPPPIAQY